MPKAKLVKQSFNDDIIIEKGKKFSKSWTFRNTGDVEWPADTKLQFTNGSMIGEESKTLGQVVKPG